MKRLLVIAFHFPPIAGSSGVQRTLRFVQHLPRFGWEAIVLTCHTRAYQQTKSDLLGEIPAGTIVERAFALDTERHLSIRGRYPGWLARPDRWVTWWPDAVRLGKSMIRRYAPSAIFSTYPIATAHVIGHSLARASGVPWIADFRDPMAQEGYPADPRTWASFKRVEERVFSQAAACTFTTPGAAALYRNRYPDSSARMEIIENGYDEEAFNALQTKSASQPLNPGVLTILHSGIVYPSERDPTELFAALGLLKQRGVDEGRLRIRFRAPVHEHLLRSLARRNDVERMVEILPHLPYREALAEMLRADGLLLLQAANCNEQVPAKLYEYLRAGRPLMALTDEAGDTAKLLRAGGIDAISRLDTARDIAALLGRFVNADYRGMVAHEQAVAGASRAARAQQLGRLMDSLTRERRELSHQLAARKP
jgi:glycosyltransferase involved in cell wall biosynthesis